MSFTIHYQKHEDIQLQFNHREVTQFKNHLMAMPLETVVTFHLIKKEDPTNRINELKYDAHITVSEQNLTVFHLSREGGYHQSLRDNVIYTDNPSVLKTFSMHLNGNDHLIETYHDTDSETEYSSNDSESDNELA